MAYRSSSSTGFAGTTNLTATAPPGYQANDRLIAFVVQDSPTGTITPPANWVSIGIADNQLNQPDGQKARLFELKSATGSDSFAFTSSVTDSAIIQVVAFSGRSNVLSASVMPTVNTASNASPVLVNLSGLAANAGDDIGFFAQLDQIIAASTWGFDSPAGYTERQDTSNGDWVTSTVATKDNVSAGSTGVLAATATRVTGTGNAGYSGFVVVVPALTAYVYRPPFNQQAGFSGNRRVLGMLAMAKNANAKKFFNSLLFVPALASGVGFTGTSQSTAKDQSAAAKTGQAVGSSRAGARSSSTAQKLVTYNASQLAVVKDAGQANKQGNATATTQAVAKEQSAAQKVIVTSFIGDSLSVARSQGLAAKLGAGVASQLATVKDQASSNKRGSATGTAQSAVKGQGTANKRASATGTTQTVAKDQSTAQKVVAGSFTGDSLSVARSQGVAAKLGIGVASQLATVKDQASSNKLGSVTGMAQSAVKGQGTVNKLGSATGTAQTVTKDQSTAQKVVAGSFTGDSLIIAKANSAAAKRGTGVASQLATIKDTGQANKLGSTTSYALVVGKHQSAINAPISSITFNGKHTIIKAGYGRHLKATNQYMANAMPLIRTIIPAKKAQLVSKTTGKTIKSQTDD